MIRAAKVIGVVVGGVMLVVVVLVLWIGGTQSGTRFALTQVQKMLPDGIDLGTARGRLGDDLEIEAVRIELASLELTISRLGLRWSPAKLLRGRLHIAELAAHGVRYQALPHEPEEPDEPFTLPERLDLPVSVRLELLHVTDIEARMAPDADPLTVEQVTVGDVAFADARVELGAMEVTAPRLEATGRLAAVLGEDYPLNALLRWRLSPAGYAPLVGTTRLDGSLANLAVDQRIANPYGVVLTGNVAHLLHGHAPPTLSVTLDAAGVRLGDIGAELPDASVDVGLELEGPVHALLVEARAAGTDAEERRFEAELRALAAPDAITVEELTVRQADREGVLEGAGRIALAEQVSADLTLRWRALGWPLTGERTIVSPRGTLELRGPPSDYQFDLEARVEPEAAPGVDLRLAGGGDLTSAALAITAETNEGLLEGSIDARWDPEIKVAGSLTARDFDPATFASAWPGRVDMALDASARAGDDHFSVTVSRFEAGGTLRGERLAVIARGYYRHDPQHPQGGRHVAAVEQLDASLGDTWLEVTGQLGEQTDLAWRLESEGLSSAWPELEGTLSGSGRVAGPVPRVRIAAELEGRGIAYAGHRLSGFDLDADVDLSGATASRLAVTARDGAVAGTTLRRLVFEADGTPREHRLRLELDGEPVRADMEIDGAVEEPWGDHPVWHFTLAAGELGYDALAPWRLMDSASGTVAATRFGLERHCWSTAEGRICLGGQHDHQGMAVSLDLEALPFAYFGPLLPEDLELEGSIGGSAEVAQTTGQPLTARGVFTTTAGEVTLPAGEPGGMTTSATVRLEPSRVTVDVDPSHARLNAEIQMDQGHIGLEAVISASIGGGGDVVTGRPLSDQELTGSFTAEFPDLAFVSNLVAPMHDVEGSLSGTLELSGTFREPALSGSIEINGGSMFVTGPGVTLTDLRAVLQGRGRDGVALTASAVSGDGTVTLDGRMSLPGDGFGARLDIDGEGFQVLNNDDGRVWISPDLTVRADAERIELAGTVRIPKARLTPGARSPAAVTASQDQILISEETEAAVADPARDLFAEIRLVMGEEVHFDGFGLTTRIEGNVLIDQQPATPTTATGELRLVDGEYRAYGQGLVIETGVLYFAGPVTQPALDVRAVRRPREGIVVGAHVQGNLEEPTFELFSEPPMTQQEQLSYLVLGRSLEEAPAGQENALSRAALALGLRGGDFLARNLGERVGIDEIGIETGTGEAGAPSDPAEAALVIGTYLSPRLYVSYGIGLFNPETVLEMHYEISRRWTLVTQSTGDATGADLLYSVERGGN